MSLWGTTDTLASTPKFVARKAYFDSSSASVVIAASNTINLIPSNTGFSTGDAVYYSINGGTVIGGLTDGTTYYVRVVAAGQIELYDTQAHAIDTGSTTGRVDITDVGVGVQTLQRTGAANALDHNWNGKAIVFVDSDEARTTANRAKGIKNAGWWLYSTYTDTNSVTRHKASCLVAITGAVGATAAGDREDTIAVDLTITIGTHPQNASVTAPAPATFTVAATVNSTQVPLSYQWQIQQEGAGAWANIADATSASYTTGATATGDGAGATDGDKYRVVVTAGDTTVTSNTATLTVA